ncbi:GAF and ANTAR domain-containing protein [soil metagenome]
MSGSGVDVLARLDAVSDALAALNTTLNSEDPLDQVLHQVARNAVNAIFHADAVSITVLGEIQSQTLACTDEYVLALDAQQYSSGRGPCLTAAETGRPVRVALAAGERRWPEFVAAAQASGVRATLSIPLVIPSVEATGGEELLGSMNAYSRSISEFDPVDEKLLSIYTGVASEAVASGRRWRRLRDTVSQLEEALVSRSDIDQAKGVMRVLNGGTADEAFAALVQRSQRENVKLRDLARQIVEEMSRSLPTQ